VLTSNANEQGKSSVSRGMMRSTTQIAGLVNKQSLSVIIHWHPTMYVHDNGTWSLSNSAIESSMGEAVSLADEFDTYQNGRK
jgi:hypothetical protein